MGGDKLDYYGWNSTDVLCRRPNNGWTLTTIFGEILQRAEDMFGIRDRSYTILGIEFDDGGPFVWITQGRAHATIVLSMGARSNSCAAVFELSHEVVHILNPSAGRSNVLEEGIATYYSRYICERSFEGGLAYAESGINGEYRYALNAIFPMVPSIAKIRQVRESAGTLKKVTTDVLRGAFPELESGRAELLCSAPFNSQFAERHPLFALDDENVL